MYLSRQSHRKILIFSSLFLVVFGYLVFFLGAADSAGEKVAMDQSESLSVPKVPTPLLQDENGPIKVEDEIVPEGLSEYVVVTGGCEAYFVGECLLVRSGPGSDYPAIQRLRNDIVLKVENKVVENGQTWYKIVFDEWLRYPERLNGDWYVSADFVERILDVGEMNLSQEDKPKVQMKSILVDRSEQKLYAYDNGEIFMEVPISTGLELTPTPRGVFTVFRKTPSRYMQGPLPYLSVQKVYDLPGVPWNLYFTEGGAVIHGAYWHNEFGKPYSHGCVNLDPDNARELYGWAELGMTVTVQD